MLRFTTTLWCFVTLAYRAAAAPTTVCSTPDPVDLCSVHDFDACALQPAVRYVALRDDDVFLFF